MGYLRTISTYPERITLSDINHMISLVDSVIIGVETPKIDSECFLEKEFIELIHMNP